MTKARPCLVCGKMTSKSLYNDKRLDFAVCSGKCEHQFVQTCESAQEAKMLLCLDGKIRSTERDLKVGWGVAGVGVILVLASFLVSSPFLFMIGAVMMAVGASSTRIFEDKKEKLTKKRKRISI
jgi:hypothetical protein